MLYQSALQDVEATCRAVKRLQIAATEDSAIKCNEVSRFPSQRSVQCICLSVAATAMLASQTVQIVSNPEPARDENAAAITECMHAAMPSASLAGAAYKVRADL